MSSVSVIVPCRNEEAHIGDCVRSLLSSDYVDGSLELLVIDGRSGDGTRRVLEELARTDVRLTVLDNPRMTTPAALNLGLRSSSGAFVLRADAHAIYPSDYIRRCVDLLRRSGAANAGGRVVAIPKSGSIWAHAIAHALSSRLGVGASPFRVGGVAGYADTVPFGAFRRSLFLELGHFDERLTRCQDSAFNARIRHAGKRIVFDPTIVVTYRCRDRLIPFCRQAFFTGQWMLYAARIYPFALRWRRLVPAVFVAYLFTLLASAALLDGIHLAAAVPLATYVLLVLVSAARASRRPLVALACAAAIVLLHLSYGAGTLVGVGRLATGWWRRDLGEPLAC